MMQEMRRNNCNGLAVISSLRIFSVGHCRNCCNIVIMSQLYPSEVVTSHFLHCYCSMTASWQLMVSIATIPVIWKPNDFALYGGQGLATLDEYIYYNSGDTLISDNYFF